MDAHHREAFPLGCGGENVVESHELKPCRSIEDADQSSRELERIRRPERMSLEEPSEIRPKVLP